MAEIWGIILAAGESKRLKGGKLLLPYRDSTIVETTVTNALLSELDEVLVVLGKYSEKIRSLEGIIKVKTCYNSNYREGMLSSVLCGLNNLPEEVTAAMIMPGDYPSVSSGVYNELIRQYSISAKGLIVPVCQGKRGHPLLMDMKYREQVEKLDPSEGLRSLLGTYSRDILEVDVNETGILRDIDTLGDYHYEMKQNI